MTDLESRLWAWLHQHHREHHAFTPEQFAQDEGLAVAQARQLFLDLAARGRLKRGWRLTCPICQTYAGTLWQPKEETVCWEGHRFAVAGNAVEFWQPGLPPAEQTEPSTPPGSVVFNKRRRR